ncbi:MAG: peptidoglycan DD-metalloendopeptidase family protein [Oscillospiraceae bacterium]|nr:peptidoglycan DD-metalloendopeptidase family protein [Oscillospiraceae bacterium]
MKNKLFGRLGDSLKGNWLIVFLLVSVISAGLFTYRTVSGINRRLENQRLQGIESTPEPQPTEPVEDVQQEAPNVPLPAKPNPTAAPKPTPQETQTEPENQPVAEPQPAKKFVLPVNGKIFYAFSGDELVYNRTLDDWRTHNGIDISAAPNDRVKAGADGIVKRIYEDGMLGTVVEVEHDGFTARYCGLNPSTYVKTGDAVTQNQTMGTVGEISMEVAEESHIHLEIIKDGKAVNPDTLLK